MTEREFIRENIHLSMLLTNVKRLNRSILTICGREIQTQLSAVIFNSEAIILRFSVINFSHTFANGKE
jgi:hypothetical protein